MSLPPIDLLRLASLCVLLAGAETLHGIARTVLLAPRVGKALAVKLSIVSGSLIAFGLCWVFVPGIGAAGLGQHLGLGVVLAAFMAAFDIVIGRRVMRLKWARVRQDFDPRSGNFLSVGLLLLAGMPAAVAWLRGGP
jgi:hypothetical protein